MHQINLSRISESSDSGLNTGFIVFDNMDDPDTAVVIDDKSPSLLKVHLVLICLRGEIRFISGVTEHVCSGGMFCILVKDSICRFLSVSPDCVLAGMTSETNTFHTTTSYVNLVEFYRRYWTEPAFLMSPREKEEIIRIYRGLKSIHTAREYVYQKEIRQAYDLALFYILLGHVNVSSDSPRIRTTRQKLIFQSFISNLSTHFRQERKLDFYAGLQCVTTKYLSSAVKQESGVSAHEWISDYVMIEARNLLCSGELSVQEVSDRLHFPNQSFFGKFFKSHEGISPLQYQQNALRV